MLSFAGGSAFRMRAGSHGGARQHTVGGGEVSSSERVSAPVAPQRTQRKIALVLFEGFPLLQVGAVAETLRLASRLQSVEREGAPYETHMISTHGGNVRSASLVDIPTQRCEPEAELQRFRAVFVAYGGGADRSEAPDHFDGLRAILGRAEFVFPINDKASLAAATSPSWLRNDIVRTAHFHPAAGRLHNAASPAEIALGLVETDLGSDLARRTACCIDLPWRPPLRAPLARPDALKPSAQIESSIDWLKTNAIRAITMEDAARAALMSTRNYLRRFKLETGMTPSGYLLRVRMELCCRLLANTALPVDKVARRCGVGSGGRLSRLFIQHLGCTPTEYRARKQRGLARH